MHADPIRVHPIHPTSHSPRDPGTSCPHLVLLLEAVALRRLHLVDVLQEVGHAHGRVQLPRVVRGALAAALAPGGAPQEAAGLVDHTATLVTCTGRDNQRPSGQQNLGLHPHHLLAPTEGRGKPPWEMLVLQPLSGDHQGSSLKSHSYPLVLSAALPAPQSQKCPAQPFRSPADILEISGQGRKGVITSFPIGWNNELPCRQARAPCPNIHARSRVEKSPCQSLQHSLTVHFPHC